MLRDRFSQNGLALVIVLWMTALLTVIAGSFAYAMRSETLLGTHVQDKAKARALARAGLHYALARLQDGREEWRIPLNGQPVMWSFAGGEVEISAVSEQGLIDLNSADPRLLEKVFVYGGMSEEEAHRFLDVLQDWRDPDDARRVNGAEDGDYQAAGLNFGAKDAAFNSVEELQQVLGVTFDLYERVAPLLTVHSLSSGVNPRYAPPEVLALLTEDDPEGVNAYLEMRSGDPDAQPAFNSPFFTQGERATYRIRVRAELSSGRGTAGEETVVALSPRQDPPFTIRQRREVWDQ